ncbi:hypothetical protein [Microcoleus sp. B3-D7]|uniref:hypothetical protein n=1 Tax=Microcoleus sp. B3-D7 TaxID=2818659 RepID=UPI002FD164F7
MKILTKSILFILLFTNPVLANELNKAEKVFANYQSLERAFDPAVADLYCDTALIRNVRTYPGGRQRTLEFPAPKYKDLIRAAMPVAKARGDYSTYSKIVYSLEGKNVRITATRFSVMKNYSSTISLLVGKCNSGQTGVLEEISQSRP